MNCLKCGREISEDEVFCVECLLDAQRYPVDPGAAVYLPRRTSGDAARKVVRRRPVPVEEQLKNLRVRIRNLTIALIAAVVVALALLIPTISYLTENRKLPGQDYRTPTTAPTVEPTVTTAPAETTIPIA